MTGIIEALPAGGKAALPGLRRRLRTLESQIDPARWDAELSASIDQLHAAIATLEARPSRRRESSRRALIFARDSGICSRCGRDTEAFGIGWEADHIVPVADGGGERGIANLRTLCRYPCHPIVTAQWRRARSARGRREARQVALLNGWQRDD